MKVKTIVHILLVGLACYLAVGFTLALGSKLVIRVPVKEPMELWWLNRDEGWNLVETKGEGGCVGDMLTDRVTGIAIKDSQIITQRRDGQIQVFSISGKPHVFDDPAAEKTAKSTKLQNPEDLRNAIMARKYWWLFALEIGCAVMWARRILLRAAKQRAARST